MPNGGNTRKQIRLQLSVGFILAILLIGLSASFLPKVGAEPAGSSAKIWTDKADYHPGTTVTIYGSGFAAYTQVSLDVTKVKDGTVTNWHVMSNANGSFTAIYQIDKHGAPLYKIASTDGTNNAKTTFTDSAILLSPNSGLPGDTVSVSYIGNNFTPDDTITASFDGYVGTFTLSGTTTVDSLGGFSGITFAVPSCSSGTHNVNFYDQHGDSGYSSFTVLISQPITVTIANSTPAADVTVYDTTASSIIGALTAGDSLHYVSMPAGDSYILTFSNLPSNIQDGFNIAGVFSGASGSYVADGSTNPSLTAYEQVQNTFAVMGLSGTDTVELTGTYLGTSS